MGYVLFRPTKKSLKAKMKRDGEHEEKRKIENRRKNQIERIEEMRTTSETTGIFFTLLFWFVKTM